MNPRTAEVDMTIAGPHRRPLLRPRARRSPASHRPVQVPAVPVRHRGSPPRLPTRYRQEAVGEGSDRRQVEGEQLGQEARAGPEAEGPDGFRALPGHAPQEAGAIRGAQGSGQDQGLGIIGLISNRSREGWIRGVAGIRTSGMEPDRKTRGGGKDRCIPILHPFWKGCMSHFIAR